MEYETIQIPKFKMSFRLNLAEMLKQMGMPTAFGPGAEFQNMGTSPMGSIMISKVVHEAFIEVNEEGTEAAAATAVGAVARSLSHPTRFIADRPFLFIIRHIPSNTALFIGKISNPKY